MDLIFSECVQLTKEFEELLKLLRDLNDCNFSLKENAKTEENIPLIAKIVLKKNAKTVIYI